MPIPAHVRGMSESNKINSAIARYDMELVVARGSLQRQSCPTTNTEGTTPFGAHQGVGSAMLMRGVVVAVLCGSRVLKSTRRRGPPAEGPLRQAFFGARFRFHAATQGDQSGTHLVLNTAAGCAERVTSDHEGHNQYCYSYARMYKWLCYSSCLFVIGTVTLVVTPTITLVCYLCW